MNASQTVGPILFLDHADDDMLDLAALFIAPAGQAIPPIDLAGVSAQPEPLAAYATQTVHRARFRLPQGGGEYRWNGAVYSVHTDLRGDARIGYVSCNGEEIGDMDREGSERNVMWSRLRDEHRESPFALLLHGGDQVYADEVTHGHPLTEHWPDRIPDEPAGLEDLNRHLRERFLERYIGLYAAPEFAWLAARVPSLMQWDDHDICDGWGSLRRKATESAIGRTLFAAAREAFLLFQSAAVEGDLPVRFGDPQGRHLGWRIRAPGVCIIAPDLRSERGRTEILGPGGWEFMRAQEPLGPGEQWLVMSSVPLLGPRLSLLESLMLVVPRMQRYEDDLRDQWQSHAHRPEWRQMLELMVQWSGSGAGITVLSGEIHLATRAVMPLAGDTILHQLVASGISHRPPPKAWARLLGALASLGDDPLPGRHIQIRRIPGQTTRYVAERNYLTLARTGGEWRASWRFEESGRSPDLPL